MELIISFKEKPSPEVEKRLLDAGAALCGQSYRASGQIADLLRVLAIAESEPDHSIILKGGDANV